MIQINSMIKVIYFMIKYLAACNNLPLKCESKLKKKFKQIKFSRPIIIDAQIENTCQTYKN